MSSVLTAATGVRELSTESLRALSCEVPAGTITVFTSARATALVTWTKRPDPAIPGWDRWAIQLEEEPGRLAVEIVPPDGAGRMALAGRAPEYDVTVELPNAAGLERCLLGLAAGSITVSDFSAGVLEASGAAVSIAVARFRGAATIASASGDIGILECHGTIRASTEAGAVRVVAGNGALDLAAAAGAVIVEAGRGARGSVNAKSGAGKIDIALAEGANATLRLRQSVGSPKIDSAMAKTGRDSWVLGSGEDLSISAQVSAGRIAARVIPPGG